MIKDYGVEDFGRDHVSLLLYIETRLVDGDGSLDNKHLRRSNRAAWDEKHRSRLRDGRLAEDLGHDGIRCLLELRVAGYVVLIYDTPANMCLLTELGWATAHALRRQRADKQLPVFPLPVTSP